MKVHKLSNFGIFEEIDRLEREIEKAESEYFLEKLKEDLREVQREKAERGLVSRIMAKKADKALEAKHLLNDIIAFDPKLLSKEDRYCFKEAILGLINRLWIF